MEGKEVSRSNQTFLNVVSNGDKGQKVKRIFFILALLIVISIGLISYISLSRKFAELRTQKQPPTLVSPPEKIKVEKFASKEEFKIYLNQSMFLSGLNEGLMNINIAAPQTMIGQDLSRPFGEQKEISGEGEIQQGTVERVSQTNVQVQGIDEPDIVKTDGKSIFFSQKPIHWRPIEPIEPLGKPNILPVPSNKTKIISAYPPQSLSQDSTIDKFGNLLLLKDRLIIFLWENIYGFDVSDRKTPKEVWNFEMDSGQTFVSARLFGDKIYMITKRTINNMDPCPIPLGGVNTQTFVDCREIYRPSIPIPSDTIFSVFVLNPDNGQVLDKASFVGSSAETVTYMNPESIYITYTIRESIIKTFLKFLNEESLTFINSEELIKRLKELDSYNISEPSKSFEFSLAIENYLNLFSQDERKRLENEIENRMKKYSEEHMRELTKTAIVKIRTDNLDVSGVGQVPGTPLNQFSLDEYQGNLRIATAISDNLFFSSQSRKNDVYVLDAGLNQIGSILDLGLSERIYSVRFVEDKGFVVTFKQIDPFYVIDLSDAKNPKMAGELKIPGFSSYLHPITKDKILGIGGEQGKVKISLFDVSDSSNPIETAKYSLDEFFTDVGSSHHAFLLDDRHKVFFLPAGQSGYIFSYKDSQLTLEKVVSDLQAQRAVYINDYMYVIGDKKIVVLSELDWSYVNSVSF